MHTADSFSSWPSAPVIYEIDTWPWLHDLRREFGDGLTLADISVQTWRSCVPAGTDAVWLMGVWQRSPAGLAVAMNDEQLQRSFRDALPDLNEQDIVGSPYCVRDYQVDERLGGSQGLAEARRRLAECGLRLVLDYVPNHVAPDHPWTIEHPEYFVRGTADDLQGDPRAWLEVEGQVLARGRDPYFPPWPDVVQLNAFDPGLRQATADVLIAIGEQCDAVRCDMAMLLTSDVFARTWGPRAGAVPDQEYWPQVLAQVRERHPQMVFIAEVYWDLEWQLQQQGFDFCYDKRLYDRLVHADAGAVRGHLGAEDAYQRRLLRFVENHDEPRAAATFAPGRYDAAAVLIATVPGAILWHDGQLEGRQVHLPVFLGRRPHEVVDEARAKAGRELLRKVHDSGLRVGQWSLLECLGWPDNPTCQNLLAWAWQSDDVPHHLVVVNLSDHPAQARVQLPRPGLTGTEWALSDLRTDDVFVRDGTSLVTEGLYVDLPAWGTHLLDVQKKV